MKDKIKKFGKKKVEAFQHGGMKEVLSGKREVFRAGIVGVGRHCRTNLLPAIPFLPIELVATCAANQENAAYIGRKYGALNFYDSYLEMIEKEELDLLIVCVNQRHHVEIVKAAIARGIPVFVEKPVAPSSSQIKELIELDKHKKVMVGFQKRFAANYAMLRECISKERYGKLNFLQLEFGVGAYAEDMTHFVLEVGIHFIDLLRFFLPEVTIRDISKKDNGNGKYNLLIVFEDKNKVSGTLLLSSNFDWSNCHEKVFLNFDKANVTVTNLVDVSIRNNSKTVMSVALEQVTGKRVETHSWQPNYVSGTLENLPFYQNGFYAELKYFIDQVVKKETNSLSDLENAYETHKLLEDILNV